LSKSNFIKKWINVLFPVIDSLKFLWELKVRWM